MASSSSLWLTRRDVAELLGISTRTFTDIKHELPKKATKGSGAALRIWAPAAVELWIQRKVDQTKPQADNSDPLLSQVGPDSPWLEEYRKESALLKRCDRLEREFSLVRSDAVIDMIRPMASIFRAGMERARRQFGNDFGDFMNEIAEEFAASASAVIKQLEVRSRNGQPAAMSGV